MTDQGQTIYNWMTERWDEGMTVYVRTYTHAIKIAPKHRDRVRYHNGHCEVQAGRRWDSINGNKITAQTS